MASEESNQERPDNSSPGYGDCHGHGCYREDCCAGYGHHLKHGYSGDSKEQLPSEDYAYLRHPHNRWRL